MRDFASSKHINPNMSPKDMIDKVNQGFVREDHTPTKVGRPKEFEGELFKQSVGIPSDLKDRIDKYTKKYEEVLGGKVYFSAMVRDGLEKILPELEEKLDRIEELMKQ